MPAFAVDVLDLLPSGAVTAPTSYRITGGPPVRIKVGGSFAIYGPSLTEFNYLQRLAQAYSGGIATYGMKGLVQADYQDENLLAAATDKFGRYGADLTDHFKGTMTPVMHGPMNSEQGSPFVGVQCEASIQALQQANPMFDYDGAKTAGFGILNLGDFASLALNTAALQYADTADATSANYIAFNNKHYYKSFRHERVAPPFYDPNAPAYLHWRTFARTSLPTTTRT